MHVRKIKMLGKKEGRRDGEREKEGRKDGLIRGGEYMFWGEE